MSNETVEVKDLRSSLEELDIASLRKKAKNNAIALTREHTKQQIIDQLVEAISKHNYAQAADGDLKPGWARIKIHRPSGSKQQHVFFNINNYQGYIPLNIEVDVPIKVLEVLDHAEEMKITGEDEFGAPKWGFELSYPYTLLAKLDGPDPKPGFEVSRDRKIAGKKRFYKKFGIYPTDRMYQSFLLSGNKFNPWGDFTSAEPGSPESETSEEF